LADAESNHQEEEKMAMAASMWADLMIAVKILGMGVAVLYAGLVALAWRTEGEDYRLGWDWNDIARSTEQFAVWAGVRAVAGVGRAAKTLFDVLSEASADLGEWFVHQRGESAVARFRSRFL
jgi:hypothetical protein